MIGLKKSFASVLATALCITSIPPLALNASADDTVVYTYDGYTIEYNVTNSWGNTDVVSIGITNTGTETIEDWMLYFEPNGDIQYVNNAVQETTDTDISYFKNSGYNANISVGQTVTFSYAVNNSTEIPTDYLLCQTRQERESGYTVELTVNESWGSSFNGTIRINNNSDDPIEMWELTVDTNFTITEITNSWAATVSELEPYSYMLKGTYTLYIAANSYVDLGFTGVKNDTPVISEYNLTEMVVDENAIDSFVNDDIMLEDDCIDWSELVDTDADGLPDEYESEYGCNINNSDSDGDGLPDGYEVLKIGSDPAEANSLSETITDGQYDNDSDGLTNYQEYQLGTDPLVADTDYDGLTDGEENNTYHTNPLDEDTDDDEISDGDEVALGLNPLVTDSDSDGILDSEEKFNQNITFDGSDSDNVIEEISVSLNGTGYINSTTNVESVMDTDWMCSNVVGLVGEPYDLSSTSEFDEATVSFIINTATLDNTDLEDLLVLWYDESNQRFVDMEATSDLTNNTLTFTTSHFSKYLIVDSTDWYNAWSENNYPASNISLHSALTIDCSDSMNWNDVPDDDGNCYRKVAASGFINQMDSNDATSMIFFHEDALLVQALTSNKSTLLNSLNSMFSNGYTNYGAALETAYTSLDIANNASSENIIIFVSDGVPTDEYGAATDFDVESNTTIQQAIASGTKIYTIGLTEAADETVLTEIADVTGGDYFYAATSDELVEYFLTVNMDEKYDTTTDSDEDGLPDLFETYGMPIANGQVIFTDANDSDADDDGLTDGEEIVMHIVDDEEEVQNAYKYMYDYIPDLFISDNGGIYFEMISNPNNSDTDGDLDPDSADPDPMNYQLNGYFIKKIGELQAAAREYYNDSYTYDVNDNYNGCKDLWLCSYYIRQFNKNYRSWKWNFMAGSDTNFVTYISNNYPVLRNYFANTKEIYVNSERQTLDLYHCFATLSSLMDNKTWQWARNLTGWAGDLQTVINQAYSQTYTAGNYENIGVALYDLMGNDSYNFGLKDLYGDIDAVNIEALIRSGNTEIELLLNNYYNLHEFKRDENFISNAGITTDLITYYIVYDKQFITCDLSDSDEELCITAFKNYLQDTLEVQIS